MREMPKSILLLAPLVATATYAAGFSPPGGVWQETAGHLPGDPIIRSTQYVRYLMFFYCNATAFASSFMVVVLILLHMVVWRQINPRKARTIVIPLVLVTLLGLLSLIGAYIAGTSRDMFTAVFTSLLVAAVFAYVAVDRVLAYFREKAFSDPVRTISYEIHNRGRGREVLMQLATFALTVTYGSGLSTPGGFWDSTDGGNRPGDAILKGARPTVFFICNTMAFVASLLMVLVLLLKKIRRLLAAIAGSIVMLFGLLGSYLAGSCRETDTTIYMASLIGVIVACIGSRLLPQVS